MLDHKREGCRGFPSTGSVLSSRHAVWTWQAEQSAGSRLRHGEGMIQGLCKNSKEGAETRLQCRSESTIQDHQRQELRYNASKDCMSEKLFVFCYFHSVKWFIFLLASMQQRGMVYQKCIKKHLITLYKSCLPPIPSYFPFALQLIIPSVP